MLRKLYITLRPSNAAAMTTRNTAPVATPPSRLAPTQTLRGTKRTLSCPFAIARHHRASTLQMINERQPGWEGYPRRNSVAFPEDALTGSWEISWDEEGRKHETTLVLHADGSCTPPSSGEGTELDKPRFQRGTWRLKGNEVTIVIKRSRPYPAPHRAGAIAEEEGVHYGSLVSGNVLEGESDRDWLGSFSMHQVVGKAVFGMAPGKPEPAVQSKASTGFALGGRSDQKVLKRFEGSWKSSMMLDGQRVTCDIILFRNGTFETETFRKFSADGIQSNGVLRGRWNVYFSQDVGKDRFWMQAKRLWCSGLNLWTDLLFLGDIQVVDTWQDIQRLIATQTAEMLKAQDTNASAARTTDNGSGNVADTQEPLEGSVANATLSAEEAALDGAELEGEEAGEPEPLTPEQRGIFTRGKKRQYELAGTILAGHQLEPAIVGQFHMMQDKEGYDDDFLDSLKSGDETQ